MPRTIVQNTYTEEFKRSAVAIVKTGLSVRTVARKLAIPVNTLAYWVAQIKFKDVNPATEEEIKALIANNPVTSCSTPMLVPVRKKIQIVPVSKTISPVKVSYGKLTIEFSNGVTIEDLHKIIQIFGGKDAL